MLVAMMSILGGRCQGGIEENLCIEEQSWVQREDFNKLPVRFKIAN